MVGIARGLGVDGPVVRDDLEVISVYQVLAEGVGQAQAALSQIRRRFERRFTSWSRGIGWLRKRWAALNVVELVLTHFNSRLFPLVRFLRAYTAWRGVTLGGADTDLWLPPLPVNGLLQKIFEGEGRHLLRATGRRYNTPPFKTGVSLFAVLQFPGETG